MKQTRALEIMLRGDNVFLTGEPGAGKTYTLNEFIRLSVERGKNVAITASTGIAASHINGVTIHSWSGMGIKDKMSRDDLTSLMMNHKFASKYGGCDILIIDEVSMLDGTRLDTINEIFNEFRRNANKPFGGVQVILAGDLFQLPPVSKLNQETDYPHLSRAWADLDPTVCYLTEQHRQGAGDELLTILRKMRAGTLDQNDKALLQTRTQEKPEDGVTRLYTHNIDVDEINMNKLKQISFKAVAFKMESYGAEWEVEKLKKNLLVPEKLVLKVGAEVMFVANHPDGDFVNGTRGVVTELSSYRITVETRDGNVIIVKPYEWMRYDDTGRRKLASVTQYPLKLAWAVTVHKSQGMSLDEASIDLSKAFMPGMGYVALSRVRSLKGLFLAGINEYALKMDETIERYDKVLKERSERAEIEESQESNDVASIGHRDQRVDF